MFPRTNWPYESAYRAKSIHFSSWSSLNPLRTHNDPLDRKITHWFEVQLSSCLLYPRLHRKLHSAISLSPASISAEFKWSLLHPRHSACFLHSCFYYYVCASVLDLRNAIEFRQSTEKESNLQTKKKRQGTGRALNDLSRKPFTVEMHQPRDHCILIGRKQWKPAIDAVWN